MAARDRSLRVCEIAEVDRTAEYSGKWQARDVWLDLKHNDADLMCLEALAAPSWWLSKAN